MKPSDIPEQRPYDMNGLVEARREFEEAIKKTMHRIAIDTYMGSSQPEQYRETLSQAFERYFNNMKGATNSSPSDIEELITAEINRQRSLYSSIEALKPHFDSVKPLDPAYIYADPYWSHGPSYGVNVEINGTRFYALPRVPCSTDEYVTVKQAPVPANIVLINHDIILMLPYREDPSDETRLQLNKLLGTSGKVTEEDIHEPIHIQKNYLWVHSDEKIDDHRINQLIEKYGADAFMVGYPARNIAIIYTGTEETMERLWKSTYFDREIWRRYGWYE
ncbi:hypothetical protein MUP51_04355 [Candidatus Bathyarchaeota archaeon]|nr:hypothetical protein [Candidatus Bathyarchaeota archaeon]